LQFPLSFLDVSLWLAVTSVILLTASELLSPYYGRINLLINKKRLEQAAIIIGILFLATVAIQIYIVIIST